MMSTRINEFAYVYSRVRGMIGELLDEKTFFRLNSSPDLNAILSVLGETVYGPSLKHSDEATIASRRAGYQIRKRLSFAFTTIIKHSPEFAKPLLIQFFKLYEVDNLKAVLRGIEIHESWDTIRYMLFPMDNFPTLPFEEMVKNGTIEGAIQMLSDEAYQPELEQALERYRSEKTIFPFEVALDLNYWSTLWKQIHSLPSADEKTAKKLIGMIIDKNNLTWAARYHDFHHLSESEIINYTLPIGLKVEDAHIRALATGRELAQIVAEIYPAISAVTFEQEKTTSGLQLIEVQLNRLVQQACHSFFSEAAFNVGLLLAYLITLEFEIQDLTLLIEAKTLGITPDRYSPFLINKIYTFNKTTSRI